MCYQNVCVEDVGCECVWRVRWRNVWPFFGGSSTERGGWKEMCREDRGVRNVLTMSKLNESVKEFAYLESLPVKCEVLRRNGKRSSL